MSEKETIYILSLFTHEEGRQRALTDALEKARCLPPGTPVQITIRPPTTTEYLRAMAEGVDFP